MPARVSLMDSKHLGAQSLFSELVVHPEHPAQQLTSAFRRIYSTPPGVCSSTGHIQN